MNTEYGYEQQLAKSQVTVPPLPPKKKEKEKRSDQGMNYNSLKLEVNLTKSLKAPFVCVWNSNFVHTALKFSSGLFPRPILL